MQCVLGKTNYIRLTEFSVFDTSYQMQMKCKMAKRLAHQFRCNQIKVILIMPFSNLTHHFVVGYVSKNEDHNALITLWRNFIIYPVPAKKNHLNVMFHVNMLFWRNFTAYFLQVLMVG